MKNKKLVIFNIILNLTLILGNYKENVDTEEEIVFDKLTFAPVTNIHDEDYHEKAKVSISRGTTETEIEEVGENEEIKTLLEEKYRFVNDEMSTRYKITKEDREYPGKKEMYGRFTLITSLGTDSIYINGLIYVCTRTKDDLNSICKSLKTSTSVAVYFNIWCKQHVCEVCFSIHLQT